MRKNKIRSDKAKRRAQRDSAEKTSNFGLNTNEVHEIKIMVQLFYT
jgi:hypothetical protein